MKEGDIYMNGQYHNPNDFWRQRMEPWEYDSIEEGFRKLVKVIAVLAIVALLMWLLCGCRTWKHNTTEREQTDDSVRIEYREKIVKVPVTVYVEVPVERQIQMADDSSHLETSFAVSDARMIWIDSVLFLRHSLENKPQKIARTDGGLEVTYESKGKQQSIVCEKVLMSVGRQPVLPEGLDAIGVTVGRRGIEVNAEMETSVSGVYAIGDVNGLCMLAHAATAQGEVALNSIMGENHRIRLDVVPSAVFTTPELSMVGLTEEQCEAQGLEVVVKKGFFRSNGKAVSMGETDGLIKMIIDAKTRKILGCHICGAHAADLIQEVVMAINADVTVDVLARSIHGHPTLSEVVLTVARQFKP